MEAQKFDFDFETGKSSEFQTKWSVGLTKALGAAYLVYWQLLEANGFAEGQVQATRNCTRLNADFTENWTDIQTGTLKIGNPWCYRVRKKLSDPITATGEAIFKLKLDNMAWHLS